MIHARRFAFLVFSSFLLLAAYNGPSVAGEYTQVQVTSENLEDLAGLKFAGKFKGTNQYGIWIDPGPPHLEISDDATTGRFWGGERPYDFETELEVKDGMVIMSYGFDRRPFMIERNEDGRFRISTEYNRTFRGAWTKYELVLDQE